MNYLKLFTIFTFMLPCTLYAQLAPIRPFSPNIKSTIIDSAYVRIWYAYNAINIADSKTYDDLQRLDISEQRSKYYSFFVFNNDSLVIEWKKKNPNAKSRPIQLGIKGKVSYWDEYRYSEYFKDFSLNTFTEYCRMPWALHNSNCQYTEEIPVMNWEIEEDTATIAGYRCQKANCTFRGREYTAWFSMDIPISNGPWKFGGLPGLILKVYDKDLLFVFECIGVEYHKNKFPITLYDNYKNYRKKDREYVLRFQQEIHKNYRKVANLKTIVRRKNPNPEKHVHMHMELE